MLDLSQRSTTIFVKRCYNELDIYIFDDASDGLIADKHDSPN